MNEEQQHDSYKADENPQYTQDGYDEDYIDKYGEYSYVDEDDSYYRMDDNNFNDQHNENNEYNDYNEYNEYNTNNDHESKYDDNYNDTPNDPKPSINIDILLSLLPETKVWRKITFSDSTYEGECRQVERPKLPKRTRFQKNQEYDQRPQHPLGKFSSVAVNLFFYIST